MDFNTLLLILITGILSNNYALVEFLGTGAVIENERSKRRSLVIGGLTTLVMIIATLITWPINEYLLQSVPYLQTLVFVLVILVVVELVHIFTKNRLEGYCKVDFMKFAINGAVLGLCVHNAHYTLLQSVAMAFAVGLGLTLTMIVFSSLRSKVDEESVPESFRGLPITLLTAGMMALALLAISSIVF